MHRSNLSTTSLHRAATSFCPLGSHHSVRVLRSLSIPSAPEAAPRQRLDTSDTSDTPTPQVSRVLPRNRLPHELLLARSALARHLDKLSFHTMNVTECCLPIGTMVGSHKHLARGRVGEPQLLTHRPQENSLVVLVGVARVLCDHHSRELEFG